MIRRPARRSTARRVGAGASFALALALGAAGCAPRIEPPGPAVAPPRLEAGSIVAADGARLPLRRWLPAGAPRAAIVALHGFNDYAAAFERAGRFWAACGVATYAYDQRGFGAAPHPGIWPGARALAEDAGTALRLIAARHPGTPVYLLGDSMGGAVALLVSTAPGRPAFAGTILVAPAVRGRRHMSLAERWTLWLLVRAAPWLALSGGGLGVTPSDNAAMLRALARDPKVIKETRVDAIHGLVTLMDAALAAAPLLVGPTLIVYGRRDQLVPAAATADLLAGVPAGSPVRAAAYDDGYHMLLRDLAAERVLADIAAWIADPAAPPSSGEAPARPRVCAPPRLDVGSGGARP